VIAASRQNTQNAAWHRLQFRIPLLTPTFIASHTVYPGALVEGISRITDSSTIVISISDFDPDNYGYSGRK